MPDILMKGARVEGATGTPSKEDLALINLHTRKEMTADEVYTFSVVLCDNEVDRDLDQFSPACLKGLAALFVGKTGIFNHSGSAKDQVMRVFEVDVVEDGAENSLGEPMTRLQAKAYLLRGKENERLIRAIDAGIKKEVSVSCAVSGVTCSICGKNRALEGCEHRPGKIYGERLCYHILDDPTDAYEFSFVAVPAQPGAGVMKTKSATTGDAPGENTEHEGEKNLTVQEIRAQYPEQVKAIEEHAVAEAKKALEKAAAEKAVADERARLKGIGEIAGKVHDPALLQKAMYDEPMTAQELALQALKSMKDDGQAALAAMRKQADTSGANGVGSAGNAGLERDKAGGEDDEAAQIAKGLELATLWNEEKGVITNG